MLVLGLSLLLSSLFVFFRDLGHIWEILSLVLFYGSAVVFPFVHDRQHSPRSRDLAGLNPVAQIIQDLRHTVVIAVAQHPVDGSISDPSWSFRSLAPSSSSSWGSLSSTS